ncbi:hypothetical protein OHJ21_09885 [Virgibacillus sp. LDC1]|uniref:hypothetical protein n=1 Tax=Paenibacillus lautus TaxID=1401 RepID=UPI002DB93883|nr:hypothetical protein [Paenibacillus lautus]MCV4231475.1 hypothetical protein [Virgibacillus sp. LDC1]MEC0256601.1 hypothetical protein [Paenibacillus lautus]
MGDCNEGNTQENSENDNDQWLSEVDQLLHKMIDKLGVAYGIVRENKNLEEPSSWNIRIEDHKTVLTSVILLKYMSRNKNIKEALSLFMCDRFPHFT